MAKNIELKCSNCDNISKFFDIIDAQKHDWKILGIDIKENRYIMKCSDCIKKYEAANNRKNRLPQS